jgi:hypothetical protein
MINKKIYPNWLSTKYEKYIFKKRVRIILYFGYPAGNDYRNLEINNNNNNNILKIGKFGPFFHNNPPYLSKKSCFPVSKKMHKF